MTAEEARAVADGIDARCAAEAGLNTPRGRIDLREVVKSLRSYADMLDRQTVDREAVRKVISEHRDAVDKCGVQQYEQTLGDAAKDRLVEKWDDVDDEVTDVIFALMPAAPSPWRPIEEAPKDVSRLLLFCNPLTTDTLAFERPFVTTGYWDIIDEAWCATTSDFSGPFLEPTHFITLDALGMPGGEDE
jgi:hypothetical protein